MLQQCVIKEIDQLLELMLHRLIELYLVEIQELKSDSKQNFL
jgi:hypothetical protein